MQATGATERKVIMNPSFPPKPSLEQLRKQAKDVLKLHKQGSRECCDVLRSLRQFAAASEGQILVAEVSLNQAQYALAMHYGYESWNGLKGHVESLRADAAEPRLRRRPDEVVIEGLEHMDWGGSFFRRQDSVMVTFAALLRAAGKAVTFEQVAGVSGAAFRLHVAQPGWCPSAACTGPGFNCSDLALEAFGCAAETIDLEHADSPGAMARARRAIVASIDQGRPALYYDGESNLIMGYRDEGKVLICKPYPGGDGYKEMTSLRGMLGDVWFVQIISEQGEQPNWRDSVAKSLQTAVMLARTPAFGTYASGFAAYQAWIDGLENPSDKPNLHANAYCYAILLTNRAAAADYLRGLEGLFDGGTFDRLRTAAERYANVSARLLAGRSCIAQPWEESWTPQNRQAEAEIMRDNLADERAAIGEIEQALRAIGAN